MGTAQDNPAVATPSIFSAEEQHDRDNARRLAERYRVPFIDLREQRIDPELFRTIQADLMFRYNFVPIEQRDNVLVIAAARRGARARGIERCRYPPDELVVGFRLGRHASSVAPRPAGAVREPS